jgi:hypothetical protein
MSERSFDPLKVLDEELLPAIREFPAFKNIFEKEEQSQGEEDFKEKIGQETLRAVHSGFRPVWSGEEILRVVSEKRANIFEETIRKLSIEAVRMGASRKNDKMIGFGEYQFIIYAARYKEVREEGFGYLLKRWKVPSSFIEDISALPSGEDSEGLNYFSSLFQESLPDKEEESLPTESIEKLLTVSI